MPPTPSLLYRALRTYQVYGANTDVGKTVISTILCRGLLRQAEKEKEKSGGNGKVWFVKPVSTGDLGDADDRHLMKFATGVRSKCLWQFGEPVSPHIAAGGGNAPPDSKILAAIREHISSCASQDSGVALLETAGGVHSPGPNGTSQADLYRPLRLPVLLVADARLGGISATISSFESLVVRGYDVEAVLCFRDEYYRNHEYLNEYFGKKGIRLVALEKPPPRPLEGVGSEEDVAAMKNYYELASQDSEVDTLLNALVESHASRLEDLDSMAERAYNKIWYPFTQHGLLEQSELNVIDSAYGDFFHTHHSSPSSSPSSKELIQATFDGSASWWTQGLGHGNPDLALTAAYAAGRYGHVMFASGVHKPALDLAELLLDKLENPRLQRVFYTDNGSTGMEVAVKMGLRASANRYGWVAGRDEVGILGLKGSYHGDTMGVMDCSEPSIYNEKVEWYKGKGYWFDYPTVKMVDGIWTIENPEGLKEELGADKEFEGLGQIFDLEDRASSELASRYEIYIKKVIEEQVSKHGKKFGCLIIEPVILGAGGMFLCDPLFQQSLVNVIRSNPHLFSANAAASDSTETTTSWTGLPIVFDEVFTGLYRLGRITSSSFLQVHPDISVHAKLLTGGLIPLCVTMASEEIYTTFLSNDKTDALLHGHSYTAHPSGCAVAVKSVESMIEMDQNGTWNDFKKEWTGNTSSTGTSLQDTTNPEPLIWSNWSHTFLQQASRHKDVESAFAMGSVLAISLRDADGKGGYGSNAAKGLQVALREGDSAGLGEDAWNVHSRVLGNVLYLMVGQKSCVETVRELERRVLSGLDG